MRNEEMDKKRKVKNEYQEGAEYLYNHWSDVPPLLKGAIYLVAGVGVLWVSKYVFSAIGGSVNAFRGMVKSFKE